MFEVSSGHGGLQESMRRGRRWRRRSGRRMEKGRGHILSGNSRASNGFIFGLDRKTQKEHVKWSRR